MAEREPSSGLIANLSEQRMADQMSILDKFYNHYDSQQWHAVIEMEGQVLEVAREMRDDPMVVRVAGGIYGYLGDALESLGQRDRAAKMHEQAHIIAKEVGEDIDPRVEV